MEIKIILQSEFHDRDSNVWFVNNPASFEWNCPFLPSAGDFIDNDDFISTEIYPEDISNTIYPNLSWTVESVFWKVYKNKCYPVLWLNGE